MGSSATYAYDNWDELEAKRNSPEEKAKRLKWERTLKVAEDTHYRVINLLSSLPESEWHKIKSVKVTTSLE